MNPPLHILHITRDFPPIGNGGLGIAVGGLVTAQVRAGYRCTVVSFDNFRPSADAGSAKEPTTETAVDGTKIIRVSSRSALPSVRKLAIGTCASVVHVHHGFLWDFATNVAGAMSAPTVVTVHVLQSEQNRLRGIEATSSSEAQRRAIAECSVVHAPSEAVARALTSADASVAARLRVVRLGHSGWPEAQRAYGRERFTDDDPMLLYVGRFADINGFGQLMEALPVILRDHPQLQVTIAGGLPDNPKSERRWKKRWLKLGGEAANRVRFAGWLSPDALSPLYGKATMLVVPSWYETFGQVILEGMLHGAPLITTGAGAIVELVDDRSALIIDSRDSEAISDAVRAVLANPSLANQRRRRARDTAMSGHHWNDRIGEYDELYRAALSCS